MTEPVKREIKFRAWDKSTKKMLTEIAIYENGDHIGFSVDHAKEVYGDAFKNGEIDFECGDGEWLYLLNDFKLLQYTGLKDKNGKELFEGDIVENVYVKNLTEETELKGRFEIIWYDGGFMIKGGNPYGMRRDCFCHYPYNWKIVGNVFENPELLEAK